VAVVVVVVAINLGMAALLAARGEFVTNVAEEVAPQGLVTPS